MNPPKLLYFVLLSSIVFLIQVCHAESYTEVDTKSGDPMHDCEYLGEYSGQISHVSSSTSRSGYYTQCWHIDPPDECIVRLRFLEVDFDTQCENTQVQLSDSYGKKEIICHHFTFYPDWMYRINKTITLMGAINVTFFVTYTFHSTYFLLEYDAESIICTRRDHFRCSAHQCIYSKYVCDGVEDCQNGFDEKNCGILNVKGADESRISAINWLKNRETSFGWGRNTHRVVTALYLTGAAKFQGKDKDEERIVRNLQLKLAAALLRNLTDPVSVNELSMYVNALLVTCHDVRSIFSQDLLAILADRAFSSPSPSPGAYLTLCNANWPFSGRNFYQLLNLLTKDTEYLFASEIRAMTVMALSCLEKKTSFINDKYNAYNASYIYNETVQNFLVTQRQDGSFGNAHTTAMVTQALLASGQIENTTKMALKHAMQFLMNHLNSSTDFLSVYLTLPLLKEKTLVDIGSVDCSNYKRKLEEDEDILDVMDKLGSKIHVQYSLYIGDNKNVIHNIFLKVPENSTMYDVMKVAEIADPKYKFSFHETNGSLYIYELAGLTNDLEAGKFWLLYIASSNNTHASHLTQSPDQITMKNKEHIIMWYKSANI